MSKCRYLVLLLAVIPVQIYSQSPAMNRGNVGPYVYFWGDRGSFLKLDVDTMTIEQGSLSRIARASGIVPAKKPFWAFNSMRYDGAQTLFCVFAMNPGNDLHPAFRLAAFRLPNFEPQAHIDLPSAVVNPPSILFTPGNQKLLLEYSETWHGKMHLVVDSYDPKSLKKLGSITEHNMGAGGVFKHFFGRTAYIVPGGRMIIDGLVRISMPEDNVDRSYINPLKKLPSAERSKLREFEDRDPVTGKPWVRFTQDGSANGRTLVRVSNTKSGKIAFWTVDVFDESVSPVRVAPVGDLMLSADGEVVVYAGRNERGVAGEQSNGEIDIYDTKDLNRIFVGKIDEMVGPESTHRVLCIGPNKGPLLFVSGKTLNALDIKTGKLATVKTTFAFDRRAGCEFAAK